jgi:hypothetical protein
MSKKPSGDKPKMTFEPEEIGRRLVTPRPTGSEPFTYAEIKKRLVELRQDAHQQNTTRPEPNGY